MTPAPDPARVFAFSLSFFTDRTLRRALEALDLHPRIGWPRRGDTVLVWGRTRAARRGLAVARMTGARVLTLEDGFLRSVRTGREGDPPHSLVTDDIGIYFETAHPSRLQHLLDDVASAGPAPDADVLLDLWRGSGLSKYNPPAEDVTLPETFVLVIDQTAGDASIAGAGADAMTFTNMLAAARAEHPDAAILIKTHPETVAGQRSGHFGTAETDDRTSLLTHPVPPSRLLQHAQAIYCVSSLMGLEAILHGHRPVVFGDAFYSGRGLTDDRHPRTKPKAPVTQAALFDAAYVRYCRWVDPVLGESTGLPDTVEHLGDTARAAGWSARPVVLSGMRLWKRGFLRRMFPALIRFEDDPDVAAHLAAEAGGHVIVWAGKQTEALASACHAQGVPLWRMEDGFVRSAGLGAELTPPASLALDDLGIYYDPTQESRLEKLIAAANDLPQAALERAARLRKRIVDAGVSKYNAATHPADIVAPKGRRIVLVPGQVEDDQSIVKGAQTVRTNADLIAATRAAFPDDWIVYKPHPDVVAGLRDGGQGLLGADQILEGGDIAELLTRVDHLATITSLSGFEALLRGVSVTTFGAPFYAGWGLTDDRGKIPARRNRSVTLDGLVHAALIGYPLYWDPETGLPCHAETLVARMAAGQSARRPRWLKWLAKAQGALATHAHLWR